MALARENATWQNAMRASLYGKSDEIENARRDELFGSSGRRISERSHLTCSPRNERDGFATTEDPWTASAG